MGERGAGQAVGEGTFQPTSRWNLDLFIKELRGKIGPIRPYKRMEVFVDTDLVKKFLVLQWLKDITCQFVLQIHFPLGSVCKADMDLIILKHLGRNDFWQHFLYSKGSIFRRALPCRARFQSSSNSCL